MKRRERIRRSVHETTHERREEFRDEVESGGAARRYASRPRDCGISLRCPPLLVIRRSRNVTFTIKDEEMAIRGLRRAFQNVDHRRACRHAERSETETGAGAILDRAEEEYLPVCVDFWDRNVIRP